MAPVIAQLVSQSKPYLVPGKLLIKELWFEVPLDHSKPEGETVKLFARSAIKYERPIAESNDAVQRPYLVFLQGGPGHGTPAPQDSPLSKHMLDRGYELLLLDQPGTGFDCPISSHIPARVGGPQGQADYLKLFRADTLVKDSEAVRPVFRRDTHDNVCANALLRGPCITRQRARRRVRGNVSKSYGTEQCLLQQVSPRRQHRQRYCREDLGAWWQTGRSTTRWWVFDVMTLGLHFGKHGGLDTVHNLIIRMKGDLDQFGVFSHETLNALEQDGGRDIAPIYTLLHERAGVTALALLVSGQPSAWVKALRNSDGFAKIGLDWLHLAISHSTSRAR
ncbi:hypothetical protein RRF57_005838 [Xylaria bambusicola]|uniref:AB hydrolase-1 domain-containing protein n=1 Tax=Xylaria bambusicola TaxID=326684 RepID=A0AAN7UPE5_9PEZI